MQWLTRGMRPYLALLLLCAVLYLPGIAAVPPMDRDESRFAQASTQMLESGDYVKVQYQDELRAKKPVGIYWLQSATVGLLDAKREIWAYRLPSVAGALAAVLLTYHFGQFLFGRGPALLGAGFLAAALVVVTEAHQAKTDAMLLACVVAAQGVLSRFYMMAHGGTKADRKTLPLLFWLAQGAGILIKGPIVPLISLLTILALWIYDRKAQWIYNLRFITGLLIVAAMVAPWMAAVSSATEGQFIATAVKTDLLPKLLGAQESHGAPPGYYLLLALVTLWPAALFVIPGVVRAWQGRQAAALRFCLAWAGPFWIIMELVPTKLPHYTSPVYPALALLAAAAVVTRDPVLTRPWGRAFLVLGALVGLVLAGAAVAAPILYGDGFTAWSIPAALAAAAAGLAPAVMAWRLDFEKAALTAIAAAAIAYGCIFQGVLPNMEQFAVSPRLARLVDLHGSDGPIAVAGYHEPSLVFLTDTETALVQGPGAAQHLADHPKALVAVEERERETFEAALQMLGLRVMELERVDGFNYSRGKTVSIGLYGRSE